MNILQIGNHWPTEQAGGLNSYFFELYQQLVQSGNDVHGLVVGSDRVSSETQGHVLPFAGHHSSLIARMRAVRAAAKRDIRQHKIELLAPHFALYAAPLLDRLQRLPTVVHFHGPWSAESGAEGANSLGALAKAALERAVYHRADRLIVLSEAFRQVLVQSFGVEERRVHVVSGGVDVDRFQPTHTRTDARALLGWPQDRPIFLTVRRQVRRMGLEALVDAMRMIASESRDALLLLGGTGPLADDLKLRIHEYGLEQNVQLLGKISDAHLPLAFQAADFSVVPSLALEGFGLTTLESLACGTPVLVTPVGGLPEVLRPFAPQCIFTDASPAAMAERIGSVLQGRLALPSAEECRAYCLQNFMWSHIAKQILRQYQEALAE